MTASGDLLRQPSFFIVGAQKSGTTALCKYLNRHPAIFVPPLKELHYFDTDLKTNQKANSLEAYLDLFADGAGKICGEGSPTYLYSETAAAEIHQFNPAAKIIIMLREPVSMMYSLHSQHLFNGNSETVQSFETAIALESVRKQGQQLPARCKEPKILLYREIVRYSQQVERYLKQFGRDQVKVILFNEFIKETSTIYRETLEFLGVESNFETDFRQINSNKKVRNAWLQTLIKYPPAKVLELGKYLIPLPQSTRRTLLERTKNTIKKANTERKKREPLEPALKQRLTTEFIPDIERLGHLIGRDLSHWFEDALEPHKANNL